MRKKLKKIKKLLCGDCDYLRNRDEYLPVDLPHDAPCMTWEDKGLPEITEETEACKHLIEAEESRICGACCGSGEGRFDGSRCSTCHGSGEVPSAWGAELLEAAYDAEGDYKYEMWKERRDFPPPRNDYDDDSRFPD